MEEEILNSLLALVQSPQLVEQNINLLQAKIAEVKLATQESNEANDAATKQIITLGQQFKDLEDRQNKHASDAKLLEDNQIKLHEDRKNLESQIAEFREQQRQHAHALASHNAAIKKLEDDRKAHNMDVVNAHQLLHKKENDLNIQKQLQDEENNKILAQKAELKARFDKLKELAG